MVEKSAGYKVAVATSDGIVVNQHYGKAKRFQIYKILSDTTFELIEERMTTPVCQDGDHNDLQLESSGESFIDCKYVLVSRIGQRAANMLEHKGVIPMELPGMIDESMKKLLAYEQIQDLLS